VPADPPSDKLTVQEAVLGASSASSPDELFPVCPLLGIVPPRTLCPAIAAAGERESVFLLYGFHYL
jgi:hypothetical protein